MQIAFSPEELRPLVQAVIAETLAVMPIDDGRDAYSEAEVAERLGVSRTTIRDERLRGRLKASLVGRKIRITREHLTEYLASREWTPSGGGQ